MSTECPPMMRYFMLSTVWPDGTHPSAAEGAYNRTVCFRYTSLHCCEYSVVIRVRKCLLYFFFLEGTETNPVI